MGDDDSDAAAGGRSETLETRIDRAWDAAAQDGGDEAAAKFIDVVLAEALICPVWEDDPNADGDQIAPKMVEIDGRDTMLLFDTEERLASFAEEPTSFVALPGHVFFETLSGQNAQIALNLDVAPSSTVFDSASVDAVAALIREGEENAELVDPTAFTAIAPPAASETMLAALSARLSSAAGVADEAWLFAMSSDDPEAAASADRPILALVGALEKSLEAQALGRELARLAGAEDERGEGVDVAVLAPDDAVLDRIRAVGFGLLRRSAA